METIAAETRADALARLYDVDLVDDPGDVDLYRALAARTGGPILELAAGSGRVAVPLAVAGHQVVAVDRDPAMLARAAHRARLAGPAVARRLRLVEADAVGLALPEGACFRLAVLALNSLFLFPDRVARRGVVAALAAHLVPDGLAVIDVWLPDADSLARYDSRLVLEYLRLDPESGLEVAKLAAADYDPASQTVELTVIYEEGEPGAPPRRWTRRDRLRLVTPDELRDLAVEAGLAVELVAGGYDLAPLAGGDERAVLLARKPGARVRRNAAARSRPAPRLPGRSAV